SFCSSSSSYFTHLYTATHFSVSFFFILFISLFIFFFFFFNDTATTEIYTLSLHDALPICVVRSRSARQQTRRPVLGRTPGAEPRSEEHTSELQSLRHLVCRLLLEKKKKKNKKKKKKKKKKEMKHNK